MSQWRLFVMIALLLTNLPGVEARDHQVLVDGRATDAVYGYPQAPLAVQFMSTSAADSTFGWPEWTNGSELDAAYGAIVDDTLYLVIAGNLQSNGNHIELFLDTIPGQGQNRLLGVNPDVDYDALNRMGYSDGSDPANLPAGAGLKFAAGFAPDFYVTMSMWGRPATLYVSYAELYVDSDVPGVGYYAGAGQSACATADGQLEGAQEGAPAIRAAFDNSNREGVDYGYEADPIGGWGVVTGIELAIPLAALGGPTGPVHACVLLNGISHDFVSNQVLTSVWGPSYEGPVFDLMEPRFVDLSQTAHAPFVVQRLSTPVGACCYGEACQVQTAAACTDAGGAYLGDFATCDGAACIVGPKGACCDFDGGCSVKRMDDCYEVYLGDGTDCSGCPCEPEHICCVGDGISLRLPPPECAAVGGVYVGKAPEYHGSYCYVRPCCFNGSTTSMTVYECEIQGGVVGSEHCTVGACCVSDRCVLCSRNECEQHWAGVYEGNNTTCDGNPCDADPATPVMDGVLDPQYVGPLAVQDTQTGFGDATEGLVDVASGSELDAAYALITGDWLNLFLAGNLASNANKLDLFFDTRPGGDNTISGLTFDDDPPGYMNGLTFDDGFEFDHFLAVTLTDRVPPRLHATLIRRGEYGEWLITYLGEGRAADLSRGGTMDYRWRPPDPNAHVLITVDNSNVLGVAGGAGPIGPDEDPTSVTTGVEIALRLSQLGYSAGDIKCCAFVNGLRHNYVSNQVLAPLGGRSNLASPVSMIDFGDTPGNQYFVIPGTSEDCNGNGVPDSEDISSGTSADCNGNQVPDECDLDPTSIFVDAAWLDPCELGMPEYPFNTVSEANDAAAVDGAVITIQAGDYLESVIFTKSLRIEGQNGLVRITPSGKGGV